jgi:hypothetical protein
MTDGEALEDSSTCSISVTTHWLGAFAEVPIPIAQEHARQPHTLLVMGQMYDIPSEQEKTRKYLFLLVHSMYIRVYRHVFKENYFKTNNIIIIFCHARPCSLIGTDCGHK